MGGEGEVGIEARLEAVRLAFITLRTEELEHNSEPELDVRSCPRGESNSPSLLWVCSSVNVPVYRAPSTASEHIVADCDSVKRR